MSYAYLGKKNSFYLYFAMLFGIVAILESIFTLNAGIYIVFLFPLIACIGFWKDRKLPQSLRITVDSRHRIALAGFFFSVSYPPFSWFFCSFLAFSFLIRFIETEPERKRVFYGGWIIGIITMFFAMRWLQETIYVYGSFSLIFSWFLYCLYILLFSIKFGFIGISCRWLFERYIQKGFPCRILLYATTITLWDWLFPDILRWSFAHSQAPFSRFIQFAEILGVSGLTLVISMMGITLLNLYDFFQKKEGVGSNKDNWITNLQEMSGTIVTACLFVGILLWGDWRIGNLKGMPTETLQVVMFQPNFTDEDSENFIYRKYRDSIKYFLEQKQEQKSERIDVFVLPEIPSFVRNGNLKHQWLSMFQEYARQYNVRFFYGFTWRKWLGLYGEGQDRNSGMYADGSSHTQEYVKQHLMPFGEYFPGGSLWPIAYEWFGVGKFFAGTESMVFQVGQAYLIPRICYEILYSDISNFIAKGGNVIVNITNDMWFGNTWASEQHLSLSLFRSIENRIPIIRATNSGVSAWIDFTGMVTGRSPLYERMFLENKVLFFRNPEATIYQRVGDLWLLILSLLFVFFLIHWKGKNIDKKNENQ